MTDASSPANPRPLSVLFFGSQGAGKGTQVKMLMEHLTKTQPERGIVHIDMGAELRALRDSGSYTGNLTGAVIDQGKRMPDFMAIYLQTKKIAENLTGDEHIIADGLARGPEQTAAFDDAMKFFGRDDFTIISVELSEESVMKRLLARGRNDDTEEGIRNRLAWYKTDVIPQLELLKSRGRKVISVDGEPDVETIHKNILQQLGLA